MNHKPDAYIKGYAEFYKLRFKVTPDVLIPRPETELLVDEVIRYLADHPEERNSDEGSKSITILDLGTGSGNIAISLAKNKNLLHPRGVTIIASDISKKALEIAKQNAKLHGVEDRIKFIRSDLLKIFCHSESRRRRTKNINPELYPSLIAQDDNLIIVANLPYIPTERISYLDSSVKDFEPRIALDGGGDGFDLYRRLFQQIKAKIVPKSAGVNTNPPQGWIRWITKNWPSDVRSRIVAWKPRLIIGEIDYTHGELAYTEAQKYFPKAQIEIKKDLNKKQRILLIRQFL